MTQGKRKKSTTIFILSIFSILWICKPIPYESVSHLQDTHYQDQKIVTVLQTPSGGGQDDKRDVGRKILLEKLFPDWPDRVDFQKNQQKLFDSGRKKLISAKRVRVKIKITPEEQDTFDYFSGTGFYKKYQMPKLSNPIKH